MSAGTNPPPHPRPIPFAEALSIMTLNQSQNDKEVLPQQVFRDEIVLAV